MPKTKGQGLVFGILMSVTMAYGMEVYNVALKAAFCSRTGESCAVAADLCEKEL